MVEYFCILNSNDPKNSVEGFTGLSGQNYYVGIRGECKFKKDCILHEDSKILVLLIGVVFNKQDLIREGNNKSWFNTISYLYNNYGETFFKQLKGSYNGVVFDKIKHKWVIFSNIQSERPVYYSEFNEKIIITSKITLIHQIKYNNNRRLTLDVDGAYMLLSYGYMLEGFTLFNEVKRLKANYYVSLDTNGLREKKFYEFINTDYTSEGKNDIINNIDYLFKVAVREQFEKDREYGYGHIATLSGGLDSRMTVICAHELGYTDQLNITFSQSGYLEQTIACQIAANLKHDWIFKTLDNGIFLKDLEKITRITGGNVLYSGTAHGFSMFSLLDFKNFGIMHSGQLGGAILNWYNKKHRKPSIYDGAHSKKLVKKISESKINIENYENEEQFMIRNKFLNGTNGGSAGIRQFTETFSPFYNLNFWEYCLKIPPRLKYNRLIFKQWIIEKYPQAAKYKWEKTGVRVNKNLADRFRLYHHGQAITLVDIIRGISRKTARKLNIKYMPSLHGMNPFESWLIINQELNIFFTEYFNENITLLNDYPELRSDCNELFYSGNALEKIQVLSLLAAVKLFM